MSHEDWLPTFLAAAGDPDVKTKLLTGLKAGDKTFKVHLDGYNFLPFFKGEVAKGPRHEIFYFDDGANLNALRYDDWKITFQVLEGNIFNGKRVAPNMPFVVNLRQDPFERYPSESMMYMEWMSDKRWAFLPAQGSSASSCNPSRNSRRARSPAASASIRRSKRSRPPPRAEGSERLDDRAPRHEEPARRHGVDRGRRRRRADGVARAGRCRCSSARRSIRLAAWSWRALPGGAPGAGPRLLAGARCRAGSRRARHRRRHVALQRGGGGGARSRGPRFEAVRHRPLAGRCSSPRPGRLVHRLPPAQ